MKRNTLLSILATAAFGIVMAGPVSADNQTWDGSESTDWDTDANWVGNAVPGSGDTATIPDVVSNNDPLIDSSVSIGNLVINSGAVVTITGATLTMDDTTASAIDGDLVLSNATAKVKFSASVTVRGAGSIEGQDDLAEVQIAAGKVLTSRMSTVGIVGKMKIAGPGKLDNRGAVVANALNGILELGSNLLLADTAGSGRWEASVRDTAVLLFSNAHTCALLGDFRLGDCATIKFDVDIDTQGSLLHDATNNTGTIDMENGATFGYNCDNADPCDCTDEITSDTTLGCP